MKTKKLSKKLSLNRTSIANLNSHMLGNVNGGYTGTCPNLNTCPYTCDDASVCPTHCETCVSICVIDPEDGRGMMRIC